MTNAAISASQLTCRGTYSLICLLGASASFIRVWLDLPTLIPGCKCRGQAFNNKDVCSPRVWFVAV